MRPLNNPPLVVRTFGDRHTRIITDNGTDLILRRQALEKSDLEVSWLFWAGDTAAGLLLIKKLKIWRVTFLHAKHRVRVTQFSSQLAIAVCPGWELQIYSTIISINIDWLFAVRIDVKGASVSFHRFDVGVFFENFDADCRQHLEVVSTCGVAFGEEVVGDKIVQGLRESCRFFQIFPSGIDLALRFKGHLKKVVKMWGAKKLEKIVNILRVKMLKAQKLFMLTLQSF